MPTPRAPLSPLLTTILTDIRAYDFYAQDGDYTPEHVKEEAQFKTILPNCNDGLVMWFGDTKDDNLCWSFHVQYKTADFSGDPYADVAMMEIGIAVNFSAEDVDSTLIVSLELLEGPSSNSQAATQVCIATPTIEAWQRFKVEHLEAVLKQGNNLAEAKRADWSENETDNDDDMEA